MTDGDLSFGLWISFGNLYVSDSATLTATSYTAIEIDGGDIKLSGGRISACQTVEYGDAVSVGRNDYYNTGNGNIEITGGELECLGCLRIKAPGTDGMGILSVTNGKLTVGSIYGPDKLTISNSTVVSGRINANTVELQSGSLTVREPVYKSEYTNAFYASYAIRCKELSVSGGTLDAAWDWGEYTPAVLTPRASWEDAQPLIEIRNGTASFGGGTVILDTGCAGNTALKGGALNLSGGVRGSGYTNDDGSDTYIQKDGSTPVKFVVYQADYTGVDEAIKKANALNKNNYKDFSAVEAAINAVVRDKNLDEQATVDAMAKAIEDAIAALEYKDADYSNVDAAIEKANALNKDEYKDFSAVESAVNAVIPGKNITEQTAVDAMAKAIENAINALEKKPAEIKPDDPKSPKTGDNSNLMLWFALLFISGGACTALTVKRKYRHGGNAK